MARERSWPKAVEQVATAIWTQFGELSPDDDDINPTEIEWTGRIWKIGFSDWVHGWGFNDLYTYNPRTRSWKIYKGDVAGHSGTKANLAGVMERVKWLLAKTDPLNDLGQENPGVPELTEQSAWDWLYAVQLPRDVEMNLQSGYVPYAGVLFQREIHRQEEIATELGRQVRPDYWQTHAMHARTGSVQSQCGFRDNRNVEKYNHDVETLGVVLRSAGFKVRIKPATSQWSMLTLYVKYDTALAQKIENRHAEYLALLSHAVALPGRKNPPEGDISVLGGPFQLVAQSQETGQAMVIAGTYTSHEKARAAARYQAKQLGPFWDVHPVDVHDIARMRSR